MRVLIAALALLALAGCATPAAPAAPALTTTSSASPEPLPADPVTPGSTTPSPTGTTPSPTTTAAVPPASGGVTVVLDPGHNGGNASHPAQINRPVPDGRGGTKPCNTTGTSTDGGYPEHAFTWDVAQRVDAALTAHGVRVVLTRPDDAGVGPCVDARAALANAAGAAAVVSIHADGAAPAGHGFHVAYSAPPLAASQGAPSLRLARALVDGMRAGGFPAADYIGSGGLDPRGDLAGLNSARIPAALVECANMRNPAEAAAVSSAAGRARYAAAIAAAVLDWLAAQ